MRSAHGRVTRTEDVDAIVARSVVGARTNVRHARCVGGGMVNIETRRWIVGSFVAVAGCVVAFVGCDGPIENSVDCHRVCSRYESCFDSNYDVSGCETRCRSMANADASYQNDVDACEACIDDESCAAATFQCSAPCGSVVP